MTKNLETKKGSIGADPRSSAIQVSSEDGFLLSQE
jgi:hypothetical protein